MIEAVLDAGLENIRDLLHGGLAEVFADAVAAQGQRELSLLEPPFAQVDDQMKVVLGKGELAFVDDQPGVGFFRRDVREDLVKWNDLEFERAFSEAKLQC